MVGFFRADVISQYLNVGVTLTRGPIPNTDSYTPFIAQVPPPILPIIFKLTTTRGSF